MPRIKSDGAFVRQVYMPGIERHQLTKYNRVKYREKGPPSHDLIKNVLKEARISRFDFEMMYNIPENTISLVLGNHRPMPYAYWHLFYDYKNLHKIYKQIAECAETKLVKIGGSKKATTQTAISDKNLAILKKLNGRT